MRRSSFNRVANQEDEIFGGKDGLCLSRVSISSSSSAKSRRSFCRNSSALSIVSPRKSYSYDKLAQAPIHLTVVKLDGSRFAIEVMKMATVFDLKLAVEDAFSHLPAKGPGKISWRHVWTQFCLSYYGQKLLNDREYIKNYGVRDGDELRFVRHVSIAYNLIKKSSSKRIGSPKPGKIARNSEEETVTFEDASDDLDNQKHQAEKASDDLENLRNQVEDKSRHDEKMVSHEFRGWFLYSRLSSKEQLKFESKVANKSKWGFIGCLRSFVQFCDKRHPSYSSRVSQVKI